MRDKWIATYSRSESPDRFQLIKGQLLRPLPAPALFDFDGTAAELESFNFLANDVSLPVVGPRAMEVLQQHASGDYQALAAIVRTIDGVKSSEFTLLNLTHEVKALDHDRSVVEYIEGTSAILGFRKLVYRDDALGPYHLARDAEYHGHILVSDDLVERLRAIDINGAVFLTPDAIKL